ncbi:MULTISPECIES: MmpS family transport accessory protein [unclassified Nocardia]|uniref:MmpS family transport accessory protein n=1 Tax=unclassified Nocardia TaxID=2637762 RepID=UPI001CE401F3|nr:MULTISPECIES: MmpS family transport accessory protein [unclassified Nocardia]
MFGGCFSLIQTANSPSPTPATTQAPAPAGDPIANGAVTTTTIPPLTPKAPTKAGKSIVYEVISDAELSTVTYYNEVSDIQQETDVSAPWTKTVVNNSTYVIAGLGAQTNGISVTCRITVDGKVKDEQTATGKYAVVNCTAPMF